jgi:hypothetical protein
MSATTTQLLSSDEFCKLRYDTIPVKSASTNVSFYTNNSKMPNFELWHSCRKWPTCYLKSKTNSVLLLKYIKLCYKRSKCYEVFSLSCHSYAHCNSTGIESDRTIRNKFSLHNSEHPLDWMRSGFYLRQNDTAKTALVLSVIKRETRRYETHNNTRASVSWIQPNMTWHCVANISSISHRNPFSDCTI